MDIKSLTLTQLEQLSAQIQDRRRELVRQDVLRTLQDAGLSLNDILPGRTPTPTPPPTPTPAPNATSSEFRGVRGTMYTSTKHKGREWRGYGTRPAWVLEAARDGTLVIGEPLPAARRARKRT